VNRFNKHLAKGLLPRFFMLTITRRKFIGLLGILGLSSFRGNSWLTSIHNKKQWEESRLKTLAGLREVMGPLPNLAKIPVEIITHTSEELASHTRIKISYLSEPGDYVLAYLLVPKKAKRNAPAMLCLHQTDSVGKNEPVGLVGNPDFHYAKDLAERGYVCLVPDYPYLGENHFNPYDHGYISCTMKGIVNHMRAVDVLQSLSYVDPQSIGAIGHSLGGHNALFVAAFDTRIKVVVTSCGFTSFKKYKGGNLTGWSGDRYMPKIATDFGKDPARMPFDFSDILIALAPRAVFINAPMHDENFDVSGVKDCVVAASSVYKKVFRAKRKLVAVYPDAGHEFPVTTRKEAYSFVNQWL
jgi:dienelactone hydrolase